MIIAPAEDGENIERAPRKFERKFDKAGVSRELRARQQYNKLSVLERLKMERAVHI